MTRPRLVVPLRPAPRGRSTAPERAAEVVALTRDLPRRRDLLIEALHRVQDAFGYLTVAHFAALAERYDLPQAEVFEVASFYQHFDVVRDEEAPPPPVTVRVCTSLSCALAGADDLLRDCLQQAPASVRVLSASCIGRCGEAPAAMIGAHAVEHATVEGVTALATEPDAQGIR